MVGLLLLVPIVYFIVTLSRVQAAAFAVSTASREAGRAFTTAATEDDAYARALAAARISFEDFDFGADGGVQLAVTVHHACVRKVASRGGDGHRATAAGPRRS